jgi:hypothetical protein
MFLVCASITAAATAAEQRMACLIGSCLGYSALKCNFTGALQMLVPTVDTVRYSYLLEACLDVQRSVLFTGVTGVGKSVISAAALVSLAAAPQPAGVAYSGSGRIAGRLLAHTVVFSAQTSSIDTQLLIESKLEKKRKTRCGPCAWL